MTCPYCRSENSAEDHRCHRCGRRVEGELTIRRPLIPVQQSAAAPQLERLDSDAPIPPAAPALQLVTSLPTVAGRREITQPSLFGPQEVPRTMPGGRPFPSLPSASAGSPRRRPARTGQQSLFDGTADGPRVLPANVEPIVHCDAAAAPTMDRAFAAFIDTIIPVAGLAVALTGFYFVSGELALTPMALSFYGAALILFTFLYRIVCCLGRMDTPGLYCAGLRLLNFDGRRPSRRARFYRLLGGVVSLISLGIGLLWSLLDEERLTWHDHMSATFPARRRL